MSAVDNCDAEPSISQSSTSFNKAGLYTVTSIVEDNDGNSVSCNTTVVVYDPDAGSIVGGGQLQSPLGLFLQDPTISGTVVFNLNLGYQRGQESPSGIVRFSLQGGDFQFVGETYEWLVVDSATTAHFKGAGTINGEGLYVIAVDLTDNPDTMSIRIYEESSELEIYDQSFPDVIAQGQVMVRSNGLRRERHA